MLFTASMVYICFCDISDLALGLAIYAAIFGALGLFIWVIVILIAGTSEESIESELRDCRKSSGEKKDSRGIYSSRELHPAWSLGFKVLRLIKIAALYDSCIGS